MTRLATVAQDLVDLVERANSESRRLAAVGAAEFAMNRAGLVDQRALDALQRVRDGESGDTPERAAAEVLALALDEIQWQLDDHAADDDESAQRHLMAFSRARAASSVFYAGDEDPRTAALEAIYEACAVVDDVDEVRSVVTPFLG